MANKKATKSAMFPTDAQRGIMNDATLERGEVFPIGEIVHVTTAQFAYRGRLVAVSASHYYIDDPWYVMDTGLVEPYTRSEASQPRETKMERTVMAERNATTAIWLLEQSE